MEVIMTMQTTENSQEYVLFQSFAQSKSYKEVKAKIQAYDDNNPQSKIFYSSTEVSNIEKCYNIFKKAEEKLITPIDYSDAKSVKKLRTAIAQDLPEISRKVIQENTNNPKIEILNIGHMLLSHSYNLRKYSAKVLSNIRRQEQKRNSTKHDEVATTSRYGNVRHGGYSRQSVISTKSGNYKTIQEVIKARLEKEK